MNKNSNTYTFIYSAVMVILVAAALAFVNGSLKEKQKENVEIDKMSQILRSVKIDAGLKEAKGLFEKTIVNAYIINAEGQVTDDNKDNAFAVEMSKEVAKDVADRQLPVFEAKIDGALKYIVPLYGAGLWGPIWGYISLDNDANTVYSATFSHASETPGLGAEITTPKFQAPFTGKHIFRDGVFRSLAVLKAGHKADNQDAVDAVSGGTVTSRGVQTMLYDCLSVYEPFFKKVQSASAIEETPAQEEPAAEVLTDETQTKED